MDDNGDVWREFGIRTQPAFIFIDDDGTLDTHVGALGLSALQERLDALTS